MTKANALEIIDNHKNKLIDPVQMLHFTWLRVIILQIPEHEWERYLKEACITMSR